MQLLIMSDKTRVTVRYVLVLLYVSREGIALSDKARVEYAINSFVIIAFNKRFYHDGGSDSNMIWSISSY